MKTKLFPRAGALLLALALLVPQVLAAGAGATRLQTRTELTGGLSYINTITEHPSLGRQESYILEYVPGGDVFPITVQGDGTIYSTGTISRAIALAQAQGYHVVGGVNSDFYSTLTGVPIGISIENGILKSFAQSEHAVIFTDGRAALAERPQVSITLADRTSGQTVSVPYFNKWRVNGGGLYLFSSDFSTVSSRTSSPGWMVKLRILEGQMTVSGTMTLEVAEASEQSGSFPLEEGYLFLTADQTSGLEGAFASFRPGDRVELTTACSSEALAAAQWATGCGDILVRDGAVTDSDGWDKAIAYAAPRTALGVREDGTVLFYVMDGRQRGYSQGLSLSDLAQELLAQGCVWAVNLDGGGSSAMSVRLPGSAGCAVVDRPSDGRARSSASYILLVTKAPPDGTAARLSLLSTGLTVLSGTSVDLGAAVASDAALVPVGADLSDLTIQSVGGLGTLEGSVYTAGSVPGTDTLLLSSPSNGLTGTAQVHVVDHLTELNVSVGGNTSLLGLFSNAQVPVEISGTYWGRKALWGNDGLTCTLESGIGYITQGRLFTAGHQEGTGAILVSSGGLTRRIDVTVSHAFSDISTDDWWSTAVNWCYSAGIASGIGDGLFGIGVPVTRGDLVTMLYKAVGRPAVSGSSSFLDVAEGSYYADAVAWAEENGLSSGVGNGLFGARQTLTRQEAFAILGRALPLLGLDVQEGSSSALNVFSDRDQLAPWAVGPIATLVEQGLISGSGGTLRPMGELTREQLAAMIYQCCNRPPEADGVRIPELDTVSGLEPDTYGGAAAQDPVP